jgi:putative nucleotidyltransferase with HDIG domain
MLAGEEAMHQLASVGLGGSESLVKEKLLRMIVMVNRELWLLLSLFGIAALVNFLVSSHAALLSFYALPTVFSAYFYGRRHAIATAVASILLIVALSIHNPGLFANSNGEVVGERCFGIIVWGGSLVLTAVAMGTLYEKDKVKLRELRQTYHGVLMILRQFIAKDQYTQNHSYRVSIYAVQIAAEMGFNEERIEDVRAAALLHDIGKLDISREILYKAARLTEEEFNEMRQHVNRGVEFLEPVGGSLRRILPIILTHHDRYDGNGYTDNAGEQIPLEARILAVADSYDAIIADRPYRKGSAPFEAREIIEKRSGIDFDPQVVKAFLTAFRKRSLEIPEVVV